MATLTQNLTSYSSFKFTYTASVTDTKVTATVTKVEFTCTRSGGLSYDARIWVGIYVGLNGSYDIVGTEIVSNGRLPVGTVSKTWTGSWTYTFDRVAYADTDKISLALESELVQSSNWEKISQITNPVTIQRTSYSVAYNANGGSGSTAGQTKWHDAALSLQQNGFTRSGYAFKRWNTNAYDTGTGYNAGASYGANASATLYAIWNRTVSFNANGGSGAPSAQTSVATSAITLTTAKPTLAGYTFSHWNTNPSNAGTPYQPGGSYAANNPSVTLYAIWNRTVAFDANGGSGAPSAQAGVKTSAMALPSGQPVRAGWRFKQWNTRSDGGGTAYSPGGSYAANNPSVTLYAIWERVVSSVYFNAPTGIRTGSATGTAEADEGTYAYVTVPVVVTGAASAKVTLAATCEDSDGASHACSVVETSFTTPADVTAVEVTFHVRASGCAPDKSYAFALTATAENASAEQSPSPSASCSTVVPTAYFVIDVKAGGRGISFGVAAADDAFNVSMDTECYGEPCYPLYVWDASRTVPTGYGGPYPRLPCFVYYKPDNGLYYVPDDGTNHT